MNVASGKVAAMPPFKAHVRNGRLLLDYPTDLPDGEVVYLQFVDRLVSIDGDDVDLPDDERAERHREIELSIAEADAGQTEDFAKVLAELRQRHQIRATKLIVKFEISRRARRQIDKIDAWWTGDRPSTHSKFSDELDRAERLLREIPR